jgi:hypothetical protein
VTPGINRLYQYGASLGGPIKKDNLWFFGAWSMQDIHGRSMNSEEAAIVLTHGYGKLNAQFGNTSAEFHLSYDNKLYSGRPRYTQAEQTSNSLRDQSGPNYYWFGTVQQVMGNLMLSAKIGYVNNAYILDPRGSDRDPISGHEVGNERIRYSSSFIRQSGSDTNWMTDTTQLDAQLEGNLFVEKALGGDHEIRFGVEYNTADNVSETLIPNQRTLYMSSFDNPSSYGIWLTPDNKIDLFFKRISGYVSDTMTFKRLTFNLGVRYDLQAARINKTELPGFTWVDKIDPQYNGITMYEDLLGPMTIQEYDVPSFKTFSPRFSLTYDITGDGKNVLKFSAARYGSRVGMDIAYPLMPVREIDIYWYGDDGDSIPTYTELAYYGYDYYAYAYYTSNIDYATGRVNARFDKNYNSPLLDELTLSFEKQLADDLAVSVTGFYKKQHNLQRELGIMADGSIETKANWFKAGTDTVNGKTIEYWNRTAVPEGTYFTNYQKNYNRYIALQLAMTKKFSKRWMADASFTLSDWKQILFEEETFNMTNFDFWNGSPYAPRATRESGSVYLNSRWQFKLSGLYQLPWDVSVSVALTAQEGYVLTNYARSAKKIKGASYFSIYEPDKQFGDDRLPAFFTLNLGVEKKFTLGSDGRTTATIFVDAYNLTNNDTVLAKGAQFGTPSFGKVTRQLNPGIFQFGFRLNF